MPFLKQGQLLPVKGIDLSLPATYLPEGFHFPENMRYIRGQLTNRDGQSLFGGISLGALPVTHLDTFEKTTALIRLIRHTRQNVEKYNTSTGVWDNITGTSLTGADTDTFSSTTVNEDDLYLFTNFIDNPRKYNDAGNTTNLGGNPPKAKYIEYLSPFVLLGYTNEGGTVTTTKVRWCDDTSVEVWTGGNSGEQILADEPSQIRGMKKLRDVVFIYKERSIYRARQVATSDIFDFGTGPWSSGRGLFAPRTVVEANGVHYYMGVDDFHANDGIRIDDIGSPIREFLFPRINTTRFTIHHSVHISRFKEVWFFVVITGNDWPTEVWVYNYALKFWYKHTVSNIASSANYKIITAVTWDTAIGTWDSQTKSWDELGGVADAPSQIFGWANGNTAKLDNNVTTDLGASFTSKFDTKDFVPTVQDVSVIGRWLELQVYAQGTSMDVSYSIDEGTNWTFVTTVTLSPGMMDRYSVYFDKVSDKIRFRFSGKFTLRSFVPFFESYGEAPYAA